jgi:hypothetical protein
LRDRVDATIERIRTIHGSDAGGCGHEEQHRRYESGAKYDQDRRHTATIRGTRREGF